MDRYDWIIGLCNTSADGVKIYRFRGSIEETKEKLLFLIKEDRDNDEEAWEYGSEETEDIRAEDNGFGYELYGYGCYSDYHIDYTAKELSHIEDLR